ncbi:MAG: ABC transporter ATP-binding protein [Patescibacteria group bacterium]|nr:ABC transporter ATP-binding protein [Patescibacteria group bacterium]
MKLLIIYLKKYKGTLAGALVLATINQLFSLLDPQIFRLIIDNYATKTDQLGHNEFVIGVFLLLLASVGAALVSRIAKSFQDYFVNAITQKVGTSLYADMLKHAFALPYYVFEDQRSGELLQKADKARTDSQIFIASVINIVFLALIGMVVVISYAFFVHWLIGLLYISMIPLLSLTTFFISRKIKAAQKIIVSRSTSLAGSITETLRNVEMVKSLGLEDQETKRLNDVNQDILELELKKITLIRTLSFIQGTLVNATRSLLLLLMLWLIFQHQMSLGQFFTLMFYSFAIFSPLYELGTVAAQYQEAQASLGVAQQIFSQKPEPRAVNPEKINGLKSIQFKNVNFGYTNSDRLALENINFEISNGQTAAFVGMSGSGKSTIIKLLVGLYQAQVGRVEVNNIDSKKIDLDNWRRRLGYVSQDTQLFAGTIAANLKFVRPNATDEECYLALEQASVKNIIERGELGLNTRIGEGGLKLSGGERQRLAIARALLRQPQLIIFDEATSNLDSLTEKSITNTIQGINQTNPNLMMILVAHRLSTLAHADIIYVLEKGKIVEQGNHQDLLNKPSLYAAMWREQQAI